MLDTKTDVELIAHLLRRAGFGATRNELEKYSSTGYEAAVEGLLNPGEEQRISDFLVRRFHPELSGMMGPQAPGENWLYRMVSTTAPLQEKMTLFWHGIFATGYNKVIHGKALSDQTRMFRHYSMGSFRTLLAELSRDPAMIIWLDNQDNHKGAINENFGRELLELFSMGVGNYTEEDIKECARAFTGWTIANRQYMEMRSQRDSDWPYGRISWHFEFHPEDHDDGEKTFLGETGDWNGEDIVDIICKQPATAGFIARHLYSFFVADEPPVPEWPYTEPRDPEAIETLVRAYFDNDYNIGPMLRVLFNSDFFQGGGHPQHQGQEPGGTGRRSSAADRRVRPAPLRDPGALQPDLLHGPDAEQPAQRRGMAPRHRLAGQRHAGGTHQLRQPADRRRGETGHSRHDWPHQ